MTATLDARVDFPVREVVAVDDADALRTLFADRPAGAPPVRLCGNATRQFELPAPDRTVDLVSLARLSRITRLDADDLTCSVEPGVRRVDLDRALAEKGLRLPCAPTDGTLGGLFALGREDLPDAPGVLGTLGARGLLLGLGGVLAEGRPFKSGARVVKSVAGFDLHKLFVGSRGRLFAATELHLKLRPLPRASVAFAVSDLDPGAALTRFRALRLDDCPPAALRILRPAPGAALTVAGRWEGAARVVADRIRAHGLREVEADVTVVDPGPGRERLVGILPPSRLPELIGRIPDDAPLRIGGTGTFHVFVPAADADLLLAELPRYEAAAELDSTVAERRGRATPRDPGASRVEQRLAQALDPRQVLR